jgi:hypothetical protein
MSDMGRPLTLGRSSIIAAVVVIGVVSAARVAAQVPPAPPPPPEVPATLPDDEVHRPVREAGVRAVDFNRDIRPILTANCYLCHGFDESTRKAGLRLDAREFAVNPRKVGARAAIIPGDSEASELIRRIASHDALERMPPRGREALTPAQVELIRRWIDEGATYDVHWSFRPVSNPEPPEVDDEDLGGREWVRDSVDAFILAELEKNDLNPAEEADRRTWIRRVTFDLTGLPPTVEEVEAFVEDRSPGAGDEPYARVVDRLLASPHFGERWGRHWLDLMRYAETHGHEFDYPIHHPWRYRDYVIRALNDDVRYDQFVREHLAGDLMAEPRMNAADGVNESILATGWWWLSQGTHGPVDVRLDEAERIDNQIDVLSKTFLGLTVSCARCHDHKFDPITQKDYYALNGFVQSSRRQEAYLDPHGEIAAKVKELEEVNRSVAAVIADSIRHPCVEPDGSPGEGAPRDFLLAAAEVLFGQPRADDGPVPQAFDVFEDFEDGTYDGWTVEGTAFGPSPYSQETLAKYQGDVGANGRFFVNTHHSRNGEDVRQADQHVGTLTSPSFTIERSHILFLIDGGAHAGKTCVNLVIDGAVVRTATGRNDNRFHREAWEVSEFAGKEATIVVVDAERGGWGQIGIDHIVFADSGDMPVEYRRPIDAAAREFGVGAERLPSWVNAMLDPALDRTDHPLHAWKRAAGAADATAELARWRDEAAKARAADAERGDIVFADFDAADAMASWFITGHAFSERPSEAGEMVAEGGRWPANVGAAHSGLVATPLQGTLRSPTFEITRPFVHYRVKGRACRIRVIVDGYYLDEYNPLLFEGMLFDVNVDDAAGWHVHTQRILDKYLGHRAYIEVIDDGGGWIAVDEIRFSEHAQPPAYPASEATMARFDGVGEAPAREVAAVAAGAWIEESLRRLDRAMISLAMHGARDAALSAEDVEVARWAIRHGLHRAAGPMHHPLIDVADELAGEIPPPIRALAMADGDGEDEHVHLRGVPSMRGDVVPRRFIEFLGGSSQSPIERGSGRMELADRMLHESNPLPARVIVNRVWQHLFGVGLAPTPDDFGGLGQPPTHPELLDHLAHWFRNEGGWSVKALIRRLALSSTYRMSSDAVDEAAEQRDPRNTLLHRMNVRRLEGEAIRDAILAVSGRLDRAMFGPPVAIHLTPFMDGRGRPGASGPLDGAGRRSVYIEVRRNFLAPMMLAFDTPVPHSTVGRRNSSNVPAQALILMNDPFVVEEAKRWAAALLAVGDDSVRDRIDRAFRIALARPPTRIEVDAAVAFLRSQGARRGLSHDAAERDDACWADLCHVLFNLKEFIFVR